MVESTIVWFVMREKYYSLAEKVWFISQANWAINKVMATRQLLLFVTSSNAVRPVAACTCRSLAHVDVSVVWSRPCLCKGQSVKQLRPYCTIRIRPTCCCVQIKKNSWILVAIHTKLKIVLLYDNDAIVNSLYVSRLFCERNSVVTLRVATCMLA